MITQVSLLLSDSRCARRKTEHDLIAAERFLCSVHGKRAAMVPSEKRRWSGYGFIIRLIQFRCVTGLHTWKRKNEQ